MRTARRRIVAAVAARSWLLYPLLILVAFSAWSISSPAGSSPDEDFHLVSTWCAQGSRPGFCTPGATDTTRMVPRDLLESRCFAFRSSASGNCPSYPGEMVQTDRGNFVDYYPNGFYLTMSVFAGPAIGPSVVLMRLLNCLVFAGGLAALLFLAAPQRRGNYLLGSLVALVPLGMFTVASINPSSWAITSATLIWAAAVEFVRTSSRGRRIGLAVLVVFAFLLGMAARADAAAYAGLAIALAWLVTARPSRRTLVYGGVAVAALAITAGWALSLRSTGVLWAVTPVQPEDLPSGWWQRLQDLPEFYFGTFNRGLGWMDTSPRSATWVLASISYFAALFWGLRRARWRKAVSLAVLLVIGGAIPIIITTARHTLVDENMQPRYFLPLMIMAAMIALSEDNPDGPELNLAQAGLVVAALTIANGNALHTNLRRYITGVDGQWFNLNINMQWWWTWAPPPMVVFGVGAAAFLGAATVAALTGQREPDEPELTTVNPRRALS